MRRGQQHVDLRGAAVELLVEGTTVLGGDRWWRWRGDSRGEIWGDAEKDGRGSAEPVVEAEIAASAKGAGESEGSGETVVEAEIAGGTDGVEEGEGSGGGREGINDEGVSVSVAQFSGGATSLAAAAGDPCGEEGRRRLGRWVRGVA
uniref:DUF834 domain-containing protein n=1 Tax=Oryza punctata TaxID=4537 RepID=A0A0E0JYI0_ORYPU